MISCRNSSVWRIRLFYTTLQHHYLTYLLEKLPDDRMSDDDLELLAPWNETAKAEIERRANESNQLYVNCQGALLISNVAFCFFICI